MNDPDKTLELAERIEVLASQQYAFLAECFESNEAAELLFQRLRDEELQHVQRVRMLRQRFRLKRRVVSNLEAVTATLSRTLLEGETIFEALKRQAPSLSFEEAKAIMRKMEDKLLAAHAEALESFVDEGLRSFFKQLAQQDRAHARLLD